MKEVEKAKSTLANSTTPAGKEKSKAVKQAEVIFCNFENRAPNKEHERSLPIGSDYYQATLTQNWVKPMNESGMAAKQKGSYLDGYEKKSENSKEAEEFKKQHPYGKYRGSDKHHENSRDGISKPPRDGQKALDNSYEVRDSSQRVAVLDGNVVILKYEEDGVYHGYIHEDLRTLSKKVKDTLVKNDFMKNAESKKLTKK